jgi:eukaryotic-like serine/threonine-protein kinase
MKPESIIVRDDGYVKLLDFALRLAYTPCDDDATASQHTVPGHVMGTARYMPPEQARGEPASHPSDVFSLGLVFYELASGRYLFRAETLASHLQAVTSQTPAPLDSVQSGLAALILRLLEKDAADRPTAQEIVDALEAIRSGAPPAAGPVSGFGGRPVIAVLPFDNLSSEQSNSTSPRLGVCINARFR